MTGGTAEEPLLETVVSNALRLMNRLNPSTHGRNLAMDIARHLGALPQPGVYGIGHDARLAIDPREYIERGAYFFAFEVLMTRMLLGRLNPGSVFVDIGANVGYYSVLARRRVQSSGRVIAFEPNPAVLSVLRRNLELNDMRDVAVFDCALSDKRGSAILYSSPEASHGEASMCDQGWNRASSQPIRTERLDDVFPRDVQRIDVLKIDVEGAEALAFRGGQETIRRFRPWIFSEVNPAAARAFGFEPLEAAGIILDLHPGYSLLRIDTHSARPVTLPSLIQSRPVQPFNLLFAP